MTILHIITRLILGGAQQNTVASCKAQAEAGHDVHLAYGPIYGPEGSLLDEARASGATLHEVKPMVRQLSPIHDLRCYLGLKRLIRDVRPQIVHTHSSKAGIIGRTAAWRVRQHNQPVVLHTVHGLPWNDTMSPLWRSLYIMLERLVAKRCDHLIAISPQMVDAFVTEGIATADRFTVIPSGIDIDRFQTGPTRPDSRKPTVGLVARFDPLKGHRDLIAAAPIILEQVPDTEFVFIGDGFDGDAIRDAVDAAGLSDRVTFRGLVPLTEMPAAYGDLDVCVLPSYQEGQSRVLAEALLAGCGIVAYDVGGIPSICIDRKTGRLVPVGDTSALGQAVVELLQNPDDRRQLTQRGRQQVIDRFSNHKMNTDLLALYDRLTP